MWRILMFLAFCVGLLPISGKAVEIYDHFPETIHANERYVIYSHGLIAEGNDPRPISPEYGQYDFPGLKHAIFAGGGFNLIAPQRPKDPDYNNWKRFTLRFENDMNDRNGPVEIDQIGVNTNFNLI